MESSNKVEHVNLSPEQVLQLIRDVLSGNNELIKRATQIFRTYTKQKDSVGILLTMIHGSPEVQIRQFATILLKRNILQLYPELDENLKGVLRVTLVERFFAENVKVVRNVIGTLIGLIVQVTVPLGQWNELLQIISVKTAPSQPTDVREAGTMLLGFLLDNSGDHLQQFYGDFHSFFKINIQDQTSKTIRLETLKCLISLFGHIPKMSQDHINLFKDLIDPMIAILDECIKSNDEDLAYLCFDAFAFIAECKSNLLDSHLNLIISYSCSDSVLMNKNVSLNLKESVLDFILVLSESHRSILTKNPPLLKLLLDVLCFLSSMKINEEDLVEGQATIQDVSLWLIEALAINLPKKKFFSLVYNNVKMMIGSGNRDQMNTGFLILAGVSEGCYEQLRKNLSDLLTNVLPIGFSSTDPIVKGSAIKAVSYFSEFLQPDILTYHKLLIPVFLSSVNDSSIIVCEKSLFAVDIFCENMETQVIEYLPAIMPQMVAVLTNPNSSNLMKKTAISSIGSCITAAEESFKPFLEDTIKILSELIYLQNSPQLIGIKSEAIQSFGKLISSIGKSIGNQFYLSFCLPHLEHIYQTLTTNEDHELREACLAFFYHLASSFGKDFEMILPKLAEFTLNLATSEAGITYKKEVKQEFSLDSDSDDEAYNAAGMNVKMSFLDEKAAAIHALGEFANACPLQFAPYLERSFALLENYYNYFYENVRHQVCVCYKHLLEGTIKCAYNGVLPSYKRGLPCVERFPEKIESFINIEFMERFYYFLEEDDSSEIVAVAIECLESLVKELGPAFIDKNVDHLVESIEVLLKGEGKCQLPGSDDEEDEEDIETNVIVFENLTDLIPTLAKVLKDGFEPSFRKLYPSLKVYLSKKKEIEDNIQICGLFSQIFKYLPSLAAQYAKELVPIFVDLDRFSDEGMSRNIAFCLGIMCEKGGDTMLTHYVPIMMCLKKIYDQSVLPEARENAIAAICRMIMAQPSNVPVENALGDIFNSLPFKADYEEEKTALKFVLFLCDRMGNLAQPRLDTILNLLLDGLLQKNKYKLKTKLVSIIVGAVKSLAGSDPQRAQRIEQTIMSLPEADRNFLLNELK